MKALRGLGIGLAYAAVKGSTLAPVEDVVFTNNVLSFAKPVTSCQPNQRGPTDHFSAPTLSPDGLYCCISKITLHERGVAATTMP